MSLEKWALTRDTKSSRVDFINICFLAQTEWEPFFGIWHSTKGAQIWHMAHIIQLVNEDFNIAQFLVKLSGNFFSRKAVHRQLLTWCTKFGQIDPRCVLQLIKMSPLAYFYEKTLLKFSKEKNWYWRKTARFMDW